MYVKRVLVSLGLSVLVAWPAADATAATRAKPALPKSGRLHSFRSCASLLGYVRSYGARTLGANSLIAPPEAALSTAVSPGAKGPVPPSATDGAGAPAATDDFSQTNVQEAGIDEPDTVKTDGSSIFAIENQRLYSVALGGTTPRLVDSLALEGYGHQLLLRGKRLLVVSYAAAVYPVEGGPGGGPVPAQADQGVSAPYFRYYRPQTVLTEIDVSTPSAMKVVRTLTVDGAYVDARQNGDTARVVIASRPRVFDVPEPQAGGETRAQSIRKAPLSKWLPASALTNRRTGKTTHARLLRCDQVRRPASFSGLEMVTVLTIDLDKGLPAVDTDAVMTDAQTVYGSPDSLFIATQRWVSPAAPDRIPAQVFTSIHRFDASKSGQTVYRSTGAVSGLLLNSWSLSEQGGRLRVASTEEPTWFDGQVQREAESFITVLREKGDSLVTEGRVGGLGKGERIYAVRYVGDTAFVVTFRQIDPLYTVDLADPAKPRVVGELELLGYSAYLHPVSDDLLLGVGQDADAAGRRAGTQLSLFDIRDAAHVRRIAHRVVSPSSSSTVEFDPHAFLYWPKTKLAVLPVTAFAAEGGGEPFNGALGYHLGPVRGVQPAGEVTHRLGSAFYSIERSLVARGRLFTVSAAGVKGSDLENLGELSFVAFPEAAGGTEPGSPGGGVVGKPAPL